MTCRTARFIPALTLLASLFVSAPPALAADHADPLHLTDPNSNITGLFFFPKGDQYILIFNVRKSLVGPKPYELSPCDYVVHIDLTTPVTFTSEEDRKRYGGTVVTPEKIHDDATITMRLNDDTTLKGITYTGLKNTETPGTCGDAAARRGHGIGARFLDSDIDFPSMARPNCHGRAAGRTRFHRRAGAPLLARDRGFLRPTGRHS